MKRDVPLLITFYRTPSQGAHEGRGPVATAAGLDSGQRAKAAYPVERSRKGAGFAGAVSPVYKVQ